MKKIIIIAIVSFLALGLGLLAYLSYSKQENNKKTEIDNTLLKKKTDALNRYGEQVIETKKLADAMNADKKACQSLSESNKTVCLNSYVVREAGATGKLALCNSLPANMQQACIDQAALFYAKNRYDERYCEKINKADYKKQCQDFFNKLLKRDSITPKS